MLCTLSFLIARAVSADATQVLDLFGSGGGTRTPDLRIMIPLL